MDSMISQRNNCETRLGLISPKMSLAPHIDYSVIIAAEILDFFIILGIGSGCMLRVVKRGNKNASFFFCDYCKKRIEEIDLALYTWKELNTFRWGEKGEPELLIPSSHPSNLVEDGQIYTVHKACIDQFEEAHGGDDYNWPCLELIDLLIFLIHNSGSSIEEIITRAKFRGELNLP